jgi:hypothetical protein
MIPGLGSHSVSSNTARIAQGSTRNTTPSGLSSSEEFEKEIEDAVNKEMNKQMGDVSVGIIKIFFVLLALNIVFIIINRIFNI